MGAAMARFDGSDAAPATPPARPVRPGGWWASIRRPYAGPLVAAALIATLTLPFVWTAYDQRRPAASEEPAPATNDPGTEADVVADASSPVPAVTQKPSETITATAPARPAPSQGAAPAEKRVDFAQADIAAPPPPAPPPPPPPAPPPAAAAPAMKASEAAPIVVQGRMARREVQDVPLAVSAIAADERSDDNGSIVVTGAARRLPDKAARRGDWNACTVNDPDRAPAKCTKLASSSKKDVRRQAEAYLSDGLKRAWNGDLDEAIAAFDRAIAVAPKLSTAYLNRGLAYAQQGDDARALADLDRAVQYSPQSARALYNRSVLLRKIGNAKRAEADEQRAIDLDARYEALLR